MRDSNFRYVKFNNFPKEYTQRLKDIAAEVLEPGILGEEATYTHNSVHRRFFIENFSHIPFEIEGVRFYLNLFITKPNVGMWYTHVDSSRAFALNVPIQVDVEKGYALVYDGDDYSKLGKMVDEVEEISDEIKEIIGALGRVDVTDPAALEKHLKSGNMMEMWLHPTEDDFQKVPVDQPMVLNTSVPHSFVNHDDKFRVIASLMCYEDFNKVYDELFSQWL